MKYELRGDTLPVVILTLEEGESVFTESGGMSWMSDGFEMKTIWKATFRRDCQKTGGRESFYDYIHLE